MMTVEKADPMADTTYLTDGWVPVANTGTGFLGHG